MSVDVFVDALGLAEMSFDGVEPAATGRLSYHPREWVGAQVKKYEWDIDPDDADHPTIHGLRGTGILARAEQGYEVDQIANDIGMSRQNGGLRFCAKSLKLPGAGEGNRTFVFSLEVDEFCNVENTGSDILQP